MIIKPFLTILHDYIARRWINCFVKKLSNTTIPWIKNTLIRIYIKLYKPSLQEAVKTNPKDYNNLKELFTRKLKPQARTIAQKPKVMIAPADGQLTSYGSIKKSTIITAKKHTYTINSLVAKNKHAFTTGYFTVIYLAPHNYHRFHMPLAGKITNITYIPGSFFAVNPKIESHVPDLFTRNERLVIDTENEFGYLTIIPIGAFIVGSITLNIPEFTESTNFDKISTRIYQEGSKIYLSKGEELGYFSFGSTIILLFTFKGNNFIWKQKTITKSEIFMGEPLGYIQYRHVK